MKSRICTLALALVFLFVGALTPVAYAADAPANPVLADWDSPAFSYTTAGSGNAERGYQLTSDHISQVMKVTVKSSGWTRLVAPASGEYSFTVDTDQLQGSSLQINVYHAEGDAADLQLKARLSFQKGEGIQTQVVRSVLVGETLYWSEEASGSPSYLLMVSSVNWSAEKQEDNSLPETFRPTATPRPAARDGRTGQPIITGTPRVGDKFYMGWYEQDGNLDGGRERIQWTVLDVNAKTDTLLVISSLALDCIVYHPTRTAVSWGDSYIRDWLRNDFAYSALSADERACIIPTKISGVMDTVTMLNADQIRKYKLDKNGCEVSDYARYYIQPHVNVNDKDRGCWWVRMDKSAANYKNQFVGRGGTVYGGKGKGGNYTTSSDNGVRPAMYLSISALMNTRLGDDFSVVVGSTVDASNPTTRLAGVTVRLGSETYVTNDEGRFFFSVDQGSSYHYSAERSGYISAEGDIASVGTKTTLTIPMSRLMAANEYRVVLTWGEHPYDLDSHLNGATEAGRSYHVYYHSLRADGGKALLEWDDTTSYGPETTHFFAYPGESYVFSVHDYSNRGSSVSNWMGNSGAKVVVYRGNRELGTFEVPSGAATVWNVFRVDNNELTPLNTLSFCSSPSRVGEGLR